MSARAPGEPVRTIPLLVVGGYLGAGKTTLLNYVLTHAAGRRITVLVNDFGSINIDAALLRERCGDVINLENGCVCCAIGERLIETLLAISARPEPPDLLVIEASGVSDPTRIAQIGLLDRSYRLYAIVVAADAQAFRQTCADPYVGDIAQRQIAGATAIVLTKTDLIEPHEKAEVIEALASLANTDIVVEAHHGALPLALFFDCAPVSAAGAKYAEPIRPMTPAHALLPASFGSFSFSTPARLNRDKLKAALKNLSGRLLRAKGLVWLDDRALPQEVHAVGERILITDFPNQTLRESSIVLLGMFDDKEQARAMQALELATLRGA